MRTVGRKVHVDAGAHEIAVDYQQFGGSMALNIQRALEGQQPSPFSPDELYARHVDSSHVLLLDAARWMRRNARYVWSGFALLVIGIAVAANFGTWRRTAAPRSVRDYAARMWLVAAPALLGPAVVFALGPHTIFANNAGEFAVAYRELAAPWLLRTVALNWIVLVAVGCVFALISERAARMYAAALFAAGLLLWGQGNLWNADYGVLAGQDLDLARKRMARSLRACWLGSSAPCLAGFFSADQPRRAFRVAGIPGSTDGRDRCERRRVGRRAARAVG